MTDQWSGIPDEEDEYAEAEKSHEYVSRGCDGLVFLVDFTQPMFVKNEEGETFVQQALGCARNVMKNRIIASERDVVGIVFFGTKELKNSLDSPGVYVNQELDRPGIDKIKQVEHDLERASGSLLDEMGQADSFSLSDALWACANLFSVKGAHLKMETKKVLIFTATDDPYSDPGSSSQKDQALVKAKDLLDNKIEIEVITMPGQDSFDLECFYKDVMCPPDAENVTKKDQTKFEDLSSRSYRKNYRKQVFTRVKMNLGGSLDFSVGIYYLLHKSAKPWSVRVDSRSNEELAHMEKKYLRETGELLMPSDLRRYRNYGGTNVSFEQDEIKQTRYMFPAGLTVLGFKPTACLKLKHMVKPAQFVYPDETVVKGSTELFRGLWSRCLERDRMVVCRYVPRDGALPRLAALVPQAEERDDEEGAQVEPPGFHMFHLPYAEDVRKMPTEVRPRAIGPQIDKAKEIVKKLTAKSFDPRKFDNPVLDKHWKNLEALALEYAEAAEADDYTIPDTDRMEKKSGQLFREFKDLVSTEETLIGANNKRKAGERDGAPKARKRLAQTDDASIDIKSEAQGQRLEKYTLDKLKAMCSKLGIKPTGSKLKKADYCRVIYEHYDVEPPA